MDYNSINRRGVKRCSGNRCPFQKSCLESLLKVKGITKRMPKPSLKKIMTEAQGNKRNGGSLHGESKEALESMASSGYGIDSGVDELANPTTDAGIADVSAGEPANVGSPLIVK